MVNRFPSGSRFVEIGTWLGRSASYMGVEIINSNKDITLDCIHLPITVIHSIKRIDDIDNEIDFKIIENNNVYDDFLSNIKPIRKIINPILGLSNEVVKEYQNESLDFVFVDGAHDYDSVNSDISNWFIKVKENGIIGGHDYDPILFPDVVKAVNDLFGIDNIRIDGYCWLVEKQNIIS